MPTLGSVHATVSRWLRRGNVFDVDIPDAVRMAARSLERNYTFKYMEQYVTFTIVAAATEPRAVNLPDTKVKKIQWIRVTQDNGEFAELTSVDPKDVKRIDNGQPERYWLDGMEYIWFDRTPDKDYPCEMFYDRYTTWPTALDQTNWLIDNADDALVGHALSHFKILARLPPDMRTEIDSLVVRAMNELLRADQEFRDANTSLVMSYGKIY